MYLIIWDFYIKKDSNEEFERTYGNEGTWSNFFRKGSDYLGTLLIKDMTKENRYVTIDQWKTKEAYETFLERNDEEYKRIDSQCEFLTEQEKLIGYFSDL